MPIEVMRAAHNHYQGFNRGTGSNLGGRGVGRGAGAGGRGGYRGRFDPTMI